jgi:hypothetical protein
MLCFIECNTVWFLEVTNFGMAQRCYSKDQLWLPVRWDNVQHSLNMSPLGPNSSDMYPCVSLGYSNDFNYSDGFTHRLSCISAYFFIGLEVIVYLPSKDIVGNDVTSGIFLSWMVIWNLKVSAHTGIPRISAIAIISPHASGKWVCVCVCACVCVYAYECV